MLSPNTEVMEKVENPLIKTKISKNMALNLMIRKPDTFSEKSFKVIGSFLKEF